MPSYSRTDKFYKTIGEFDVSDECALEIENYILLGLPPGSFHTAIFSNNLVMAASTGHALTRWRDIQHCAYWLVHVAPPESWGSAAAVENWLALSDSERIRFCVKCKLLPSDKEMVWGVLSDSTE